MTRGGATIPDKSFEIGAVNTTDSDANGTTVQDLLDFLQNVLGIDTAVSGGVTLDAAGQIAVDGNSGTLNDLAILGSGVYVNDPAGVQPFTFSKSVTADGESVRTTFIGYDSLGRELSVDITLVLESTSNIGTTWRYYAQSEDDSDLATAVGSGTLTFGTNGDLLGVTDATITMHHDNSGAETPQQITLNFDDPNLGLSALADSDSQLAAISQDGSPIGTLEDFTVQTNGTIVGEFSNGLLRNLGRVVLATFVNPQGLVETAANQFQATPSSGSASVTTPGSGSAGRIIGEALELSNVDITEQFITLVTASTGFSANSRVFSTSDRLLQELLAIVR
jgi:flagellar hook protein FlgE